MRYNQIYQRPYSCPQCKKIAEGTIRKGICHTCYYRNSYRNIEKYKERGVAYSREYSKRPDTKLKHALAIRTRRLIPEERLKDIARSKTNYTCKKLGICHDCKTEVKTQWHHLSYEPNIAIEICINCHLKRHRK